MKNKNIRTTTLARLNAHTKIQNAVRVYERITNKILYSIFKYAIAKREEHKKKVVIAPNIEFHKRNMKHI